MEFDEPEREQGVEQLRRFHTRTVLAALIVVVVAAAVAAGLAVDEDAVDGRSAPASS